ncbi:hypothetical protein F183_A45410 [Bryobacterales bacterium F-183]|nr:hypothetical protein F183_A45410 [Bryobacterales bacterium F-183]
MSKNKRLWMIGGAVAVCTLALVFAARSITRAGDALDAASRDVAANGTITFTAAALDRRAPSGFSWIGGAASGYVDAALFGGDLFVLSSSELTQYRDGSKIASYRAGFELPPSALIALRTGTPAGAARPELLVATQHAGYLAFDGDSWRQVAIGDQKLLSLHILSNGRVLLGTDRAGLLAHDARGLAPLQDLLRNKRVTAIAGTDESDLWIGTLDQGLFRYRAGQLQPVTPVPDKRILCIEIDGARVWVGTPLGIAEFRDGTFQRQLAAGQFVSTIALRKNTLLVGTLEDGLLEVPLEQRAPKPFRRQTEALAQGEIRKVFFTPNGREMVLTPTRLLSGSDEELLRAPESRLADGNIAALAPEDGGRRLWIGYFDRGLDILDTADGTSTARHVEDDTVFCVNRIVHDRDNLRTVVATGNGLAFLDAGGQIQRVMRKADGLIANHATDILLRPSGAGLTVSTPGGVTFLEARGEASSIYAFHGLVNNHVYALGQCHGKLLAGTLGGLSAIEGGLVKASYTTANSTLGHNWITAIADTGTSCLVGTYGAGVLAFGPDGTWQSFPDLTQPNVRGFEVNPNAMAASPRGAYAGTLGKGLAVWNKSNNRWHFVRDGLPSLNVTAVAVQNGIVYAGTDNGLVRIEEQVLVP